jgi:hypothetical protein
MEIKIKNEYSAREGTSRDYMRKAALTPVRTPVHSLVDSFLPLSYIIFRTSYYIEQSW